MFMEQHFNLVKFVIAESFKKMFDVTDHTCI